MWGIDKSKYIYNYNPYKKASNKGNHFFKTYQDMQDAMVKQKNLQENEVKLLQSSQEDLTHETLSMKLSEVPKFYWDAFESELYCMEYRLLKSPVIFTSTNQSNLIKIFNLYGLEL